MLSPLCIFLALLIPSSPETSISFLQLSSFQPEILCRTGPVWFDGTIINPWERCHFWAAGLFTPRHTCVFKHHENPHARCHQLCGRRTWHLMQLWTSLCLQRGCSWGSGVIFLTATGDTDMSFSSLPDFSWIVEMIPHLCWVLVQEARVDTQSWTSSTSLQTQLPLPVRA